MRPIEFCAICRADRPRAESFVRLSCSGLLIVGLGAGGHPCLLRFLGGVRIGMPFCSFHVLTCRDFPSARGAGGFISDLRSTSEYCRIRANGPSVGDHLNRRRHPAIRSIPPRRLAQPAAWRSFASASERSSSFVARVSNRAISRRIHFFVCREEIGENPRSSAR